MNTVRCTAVLGVNKEYTLEEFAERLMRDLESIYHNNADRDFISFNVLASKTCYREEWGCPREGETTFSLEAVANPIFVEDIDENRMPELERECKSISRLINRSHLAEIQKAFFVTHFFLLYIALKENSYFDNIYKQK